MKEAFGLSPYGFKAKDFTSIKSELESALQKEVDPSLRCSPDTIAGQIIAIVAYQCRQVWEMGAGLYSSLDANAASGRALDALCSLTGTYRRQAKHSRVKILVRLAPGASVPKDSMATSSQNLNARFRTLEEIKNDSPEEALLETEMHADEAGPVYAKAASIDHIINPQAGWLGINNPKEAILGQHEESDDSLRLRRLRELRASGSSTREALKSHLGALNGVQAVHIEEGLHSFNAYVMGGDEQEICQALWLNKPLGVTTTGSISHPVIASNGQNFTMSFSRPTIIALSLHIKLRLRYKLDELEQSALKGKIMDYLYANTKLGEDPYPSRLYPVLFSEPKVLDALSINLSLQDSHEPPPRDFKAHELASFDVNQIIIEQVVAP
jgi:uncharacterized phage protein gp47/JayE